RPAMAWATCAPGQAHWTARSRLPTTAPACGCWSRCRSDMAAGIGHVLVVEDLAQTQKWLGSIIAQAFPGAETDFADSMRGGLAAATQRDYGLALVDLGLPDGSGLEVMRSLLLLRPETLCVVTTVMGDDAHIVAALSSGASGYLLKEQP